MPRRTKEDMQNEIDDQLVRILNLTEKMQAQCSVYESDMSELKESDEQIRRRLTGILAIDTHGNDTQMAAATHRRNILTDYSRISIAPSFSWEEIFFMIGGLHATSEYSFKCQEIQALKDQIKGLKSEKKQ